MLKTFGFLGMELEGVEKGGRGFVVLGKGKSYLGES